MADNNGTLASEEKDIITLVDEKISADTDFAAELETLTDEEKETKTAEKRAELIKQEYQTLVERLAKGSELANNYKIRAEKAEQAIKAKTPIVENKINDPQLSDELKLIAKGLSDEAIEQAKVIAKGKGITLSEAIKDPLFALVQQDLAEKEKREKAKLGASKGSGETEEEIKGTESGSTREAHMEAFKKALGKK